ncbi:uncharacterized protein LOC130743550 [Lotus japonicus]|uniref:uncharacterized protein LOC130724859 n=1 Tax=Lotus japonicus TaxID=34305 RepID=UPI002586559C|nr:uncharacterized protein LOC130724859 [Lotus japonicus]XP_057434859.1 uncharacterized protein LOC130727673 [Lotus japonicus]XP_057451759.1 uncharacterized protein LOC130743527 [Lotus japonicus]XP_057451780.1 uncharacterized protein LOC130743550 [Lotus japonicus]
MGGSSATPNFRDFEADSSCRVPESQRRNEGYHGLSGFRDISSNSTSSETRRRVVLCDCGVQSPLVTTWTGVNRGRRFYGCGLFEVHRKKVCNFFQWHDADDDNCNAREKKLIVVLTKKNEELQKKERILVASLFMSMFVILVLLVAYVRK